MAYDKSKLLIDSIKWRSLFYFSTKVDQIHITLYISKVYKNSLSGKSGFLNICLDKFIKIKKIHTSNSDKFNKSNSFHLMYS